MPRATQGCGYVFLFGGGGGKRDAQVVFAGILASLRVSLLAYFQGIQHGTPWLPTVGTGSTRGWGGGSALFRGATRCASVIHEMRNGLSEGDGHLVPRVYR